jgi:hypothetical protein
VTKEEVAEVLVSKAIFKAVSVHKGLPLTAAVLHNIKRSVTCVLDELLDKAVFPLERFDVRVKPFDPDNPTTVHIEVVDLWDYNDPGSKGG